jgi:hypothetical protein
LSTGRGGVVEQCQHQVLDGHEFVRASRALLVALADGVLEVLAEHGYLGRRHLDRKAVAVLVVLV